MNMLSYYNKKFDGIELRKVKRDNCTRSTHFNYTLNILVVEKGAIEIEVSNRVYSLKRNSIFIINPFEMHKCKDATTDGLEYFVISLDIELLKYIQNDIFGKNILLSISKRKVDNLYLFNKLIKNCNLLINEKKSTLKLYHSFNMNIIEIIEECYLDKIFNIKDYLLIDKVLLYIKEHHTEHIIVKSLADELKTNVYTINRVFKKYFNITIYKLIINYRLYRSKTLLLDTDNISYISYELGFYDQSHFHKNFKKNFELTPKEYQNQQIKL